MDEGLPIQGSNSCIAHIVNDGGLAVWKNRAEPRALNPKSDHGEKVCALIGSHAASKHGYAGIAPQAEIYFVAAGSDAGPTLDTMRVMSCIEYLSRQRECDLISVSAGDVGHPLPALRNVLKSVARRGTLCFFAAGNRGTPLFPAQYDDCMAVAAVGMSGTAPAGTQIEWIHRKESRPVSPTMHVWQGSARGYSIEFCAPGVGVIWSRQGAAASAEFGTSFACPIAVGVAAILLSNDALYMQTRRKLTRYDRAIELLTSASSYDPLGAPRHHNYWRYGLLRVP